MYWYYKIPLVILLGLCLIGCGMLIWKRLPSDVLTSMNPGEGGSEKSEEGGGGQDGSGQGSETGAAAGAATPRVVLKRLRAAQSQLGGNNLESARALAEKVLNDQDIERFSPSWRKAAAIISEVNTLLINSDIPAPEKVTYQIKSGDSLARIAARFNTTIGALQRSNNLDPNSARIYPGDILRIYAAEWNILVVKEEFALLLKDGDRLFKLYDAGIGRQNRTPAGSFKVSTKQKEPVWTPPGKIIPYGDPENVLGTRWLGLTPIGDTNPDLRGYGIHGTWQPETVGTASSEGCIRMRNEEVNELFDLLPRGTPVRIRNEADE